MKRSGFTMIELIFVIVILGILAAVAIPKMVGVQEQARAAKVGELVSSLNSVIVPQLWSMGQISNNGKVLGLPAGRAVLTELQEIPSNFTVVLDDLSGVDAACDAGTLEANAACIVLSDTTNSLFVHFLDGNLTDSPRFWYTTDTDYTPTNEYNISKASF